MKINISIETHVFAEEKLQDEVLDEILADDIDSCGIVGPEIIVPLRRNRNPKIVFEYTEKTTLRNVVDAIYDEFGFLELDKAFRPPVAFFVEKLRYWIDDSDANFLKVLDKHLDANNTGEIYAGVYVSADAGCICEEDGIRYYMNSRERGKHNEPHIHLRSVDSCQEAVIIIKTQKVVGKFPRKLIKKAKNKVKLEEKFFLEQWNILTDGLRVDINRYLGLIDY